MRQHAEQSPAEPVLEGLQWPPAARVVMFDTLSANNDYTVELVQALRAGGGQPALTVVTVEGSRIQPADGLTLWPAIPAFASPQPRAWKALRMAWAYTLLAAACLRAPRRTVLHVQFFRFERIEAVLFGLLQRLGVRLVYSAHNPLPHDRLPWHADFYRRWYRRVDAVHVLSRSVLEAIESEVGARPQSVAVIGHGPYTGQFRRYGGRDSAALRARLGIADDRFVLLQYGLFKRYKGVDRLVEAVARMPTHLQPLLVLAGGGPADYREEVRLRMADAGRADSLLWLDRHVSDEELCGLLSLADLVLFPYTRVSQSGALYLSMTFGKASLCSDLPGFREMLPASNLPFVDSADADAFAARLQTLMTQPETLNALRLAVDAQCGEGFNWTVIAASTWRLYGQMLINR